MQVQAPLSPFARLKRLFAVDQLEKLATAGQSSPLPPVLRERPRKRFAHGFEDPGDRPGTRRIVVRVDDAAFDRIVARARAADVSVSEMVRRLILAALRRPGPLPQAKEE